MWQRISPTALLLCVCPSLGRGETGAISEKGVYVAYALAGTAMMRKVAAVLAGVIVVAMTDKPVALAGSAGPEPAAQIFARQSSRADSLRQSLTQFRTELENELSTARARMKAELVGKEFWPYYGETTRSDLSGGRACGQLNKNPCPDCERLTQADFDKWFDEVFRLFTLAKSWQDGDFNKWAAERGKKQQDAQSRKQEHLEEGAAWFEREQAFYREIYFLGAWQGILVWAVHAAEVLGFDLLHLPQLKGQQVGEPGNLRYRRGPGEFGGQLAVMRVENLVAVLNSHLEVVQRACEEEVAHRKFTETPIEPMEGKNRAEDALRRAAQDTWRAVLACRRVEDAQRDVFAPKFRQVRDRYQETHRRMSQRLQHWRESLIASHVYAGEGKEAIEKIYGDGHETALNKDSNIRLAWDMPFASHPPSGPLTFDGVTKDLSGEGAGLNTMCWDLHPYLTYVDDNTLPPRIKYAGLETKPFYFSLGDFGVSSVRSTGGQSRVALGGRLPEEGP